VSHKVGSERRGGRKLDVQGEGQNFECERRGDRKLDARGEGNTRGEVDGAEEGGLDKRHRQRVHPPQPDVVACERHSEFDVRGIVNFM